MEKKQIITTIAENLRTLMNQSGLSSTELARKCQISTGTISKIINGSMSITIPMAMNLADGLGVDISELLNGLTGKTSSQLTAKKEKPLKSDQFAIGILSINNKRITCIKDYSDKVIGTSELEGGLDLVETSGNLIHLIHESINSALPNSHSNELSRKLKYAKINLVTQSYEFEHTRYKFINFAKKYFKDVILLPDWQITYLAAFEETPGISLIIDKGVSLSYLHGGTLKKLGGWKFPVYDLGGENWLGLEAIRHTIDAVEGYVSMSELAHNVMAKFNGKIEKITEACFKSGDSDIFCLFSDILLRSYLTGDTTAKAIIENGFKLIYRSIDKIDSIYGKKFSITINGSLIDIYKVFFDKNRLLISPNNAEKTKLLADLTPEFLAEHGVRSM